MTPTLLDRRYAILGPLGRGGMGDVFRARDVRVDRDVAVKLLAVEHSENPAFVRRFRREIQTLARLAHPNIVTLLDTGEAPDGRLYLVMECLTGETLSTMLDDLRARGEVLGWRRLAPIVRQIGHALAAAHALGVVHRDIKPSNCFRSDDVPGNPDYIRLLDFGIVKTLPGEGGLDRGETTQRVFIGTPHYAAPETFDPETYGPAGVQADIFSLGVLMYRCLTGTLPFESLQPSAAIARAAYHLAEPPRLRAPERDISVAVEAILMRAMALRPEARHASVADLLAEIELSLATPVAARSRRASSGPITEVRPKAMAAAGGLAPLYPATAAPSRPASAAASRAGVVSGELLCDAAPRLPMLARQTP